MCAVGVIPTEVIRNISARGAHAIIGLEINPFVFHAAPHSLNEDVVAPGQQNYSALHSGIDVVWRAVCETKFQ